MKNLGKIVFFSKPHISLFKPQKMFKNDDFMFYEGADWLTLVLTTCAELQLTKVKIVLFCSFKWIPFMLVLQC